MFPSIPENSGAATRFFEAVYELRACRKFAGGVPGRSDHGRVVTLPRFANGRFTEAHGASPLNQVTSGFGLRRLSEGTLNTPLSKRLVGLRQRIFSTNLDRSVGARNCVSAGDLPADDLMCLPVVPGVVCSGRFSGCASVAPANIPRDLHNVGSQAPPRCLEGNTWGGDACL